MKSSEKKSHAKTQSRKEEQIFLNLLGFLCGFAPLREAFF
jgi:hypothetical protein